MKTKEKLDTKKTEKKEKYKVQKTCFSQDPAFFKKCANRNLPSATTHITVAPYLLKCFKIFHYFIKAKIN